MARKGILAAGNWVLDIVKIIEEWPPIEGHSCISEQTQGGGGAPFNLILGLAKLKPPFPLAGLGIVGRDSAGDFLIKQCESNGIDVTRLKKSKTIATSYTDVITIKSSGKRTMFHYPGANSELAADHFDPEQTNCKIFHLGHLLLLESLDEADEQFGTRAGRVLARFRAAAVKTSIDTVTDLNDRLLNIVKPALKHTDYCILNELEAGHLAGIQTRKDDAIIPDGITKAAEALMEFGVHEWVVIHFPEGAYALSKSGQNQWQPSLNLPDGYNKGAVGAGDAFCGGVLYGLHEEWRIGECLNLGICNAAASLSHPTATGGMRPTNDTLQLAEQFGFRSW